jgi:CRISPR-associated protein Cas8b1/Cst1 subtype I-B
MSYTKGTPLIGDYRAGIINSVWTNNEKAEICTIPFCVLFVRVDLILLRF